MYSAPRSFAIASWMGIGSGNVAERVARPSAPPTSNHAKLPSPASVRNRRRPGSDGPSPGLERVRQTSIARPIAQHTSPARWPAPCSRARRRRTRRTPPSSAKRSNERGVPDLTTPRFCQSFPLRPVTRRSPGRGVSVPARDVPVAILPRSGRGPMLGGWKTSRSYGSMFLIGAALALSGGVGVLLPPGNRAGVVLALLAGAGVGIAGLAVGAHLVRRRRCDASWRVFFVSSIAGFATVVLCLIVAWRRARSDAGPPRSRTRSSCACARGRGTASGRRWRRPCRARPRRSTRPTGACPAARTACRPSRTRPSS